MEFPPFFLTAGRGREGKVRSLPGSLTSTEERGYWTMLI